MGVFSFFTQLIHNGTGDDPRLPLFKVRNTEVLLGVDKAHMTAIQLTTTTALTLDFSTVDFALVSWIAVYNDKDSKASIDLGVGSEKMMRLGKGKGNIFQPPGWLSGASMELVLTPLTASTTTVHVAAWGG